MGEGKKRRGGEEGKEGREGEGKEGEGEEGERGKAVNYGRLEAALSLLQHQRGAQHTSSDGRAKPLVWDIAQQLLDNVFSSITDIILLSLWPVYLEVFCTK